MAHEEVYEPIDEYVVQEELAEVSDGNINQEIVETKVALQIANENSEEEEPYSFVYPIYVKKDALKQFTTGDESMAVEALRQLGGMCPSVEEDEKISCTNCAKTFTQVELVKHRILCESVKHACKVCDRSFQKKVELNNHMICHQVERPHACRTCGHLFRSKSQLQTHMTEAHQIERVHKCTICGTDFRRPSSLSNHMKIHSYVAGRALIQNQSNVAVQTVEKVENTSNAQEQVLTTIQTVQNIEVPHVEWMVQTYNFTSDKNNIDTLVGSSDKMDTLEETTVLPTEEIAQFEYILQDSVNQEIDQQYQINLTSHNNSEASIRLLPIELQNENNSFTCNECNVSFAKEESLAEHQKSHAENCWVSPSKCEFCDEQFQDLNFLAVHQLSCTKKLTQNNQNKVKKSVSNSQWGKHACPKCGKKFTTKQKMFRHQWIHRKKTFSCEICSSQFEKQSELDEHRLLAHPAESPFTCNECGKSFVSRQGLWEHGRTHAGSPAHFHCDTCSKTFSSRQGYLIHHRTHTGERPYGCKFCWKAFRDGGTLRKHERIHTGERPHVCPLCSRAFNQKVVLREHVRWVHAAKNESAASGPPFPCPLCDTSTQDRDELCAHIVKHSDLMIAEAKAKTNGQLGKTKVKKKSKISNKQTKTAESEMTEEQVDHYAKQEEAVFSITEQTENPTETEETYLVVKDDLGDSLCIQACSDEVFSTSSSTKSINTITFSNAINLQIQEKSDILDKESSSNTVRLIPFTRTSDKIRFVSAKELNTLTLISKQNENLPVLTIPNSQTIVTFASELSNTGLSEPSKSDDIEPMSIIEEQSSGENENMACEEQSDDESEELVCGICGNEFSDRNTLMEHVKIHI